MSDPFDIIVSSDTPDAWAKVRNQMPWNFAEQEATRILDLHPRELDVDVADASKVLQELQAAPEGTMWGDFYLEPVLEIGDSFYPYVMSCQQLIALSKDSRPSYDLTALYQSEPRTPEVPTAAVSYLVVACPRCHLTFTQGDEDVEFDLDEEWIQEDCIACEGTGEWVYELI